MADLGNFDANDVEPLGDFEPLPEGTYKAMIEESEIKRTKADTGSYLSLKFVICDGEEYGGRVLFVNLNLDNPNIKAVEIANRELSAICRATGVMKPGNSEALHDIPIEIKVGLEKRKDTGGLTNRIKAYAPLGTAPKKPVEAKGEASWMQK